MELESHKLSIKQNASGGGRMILTIIYERDQKMNKSYDIVGFEQVEEKLKEWFEEFEVFTSEVNFRIDGAAVFAKQVSLKALYG